MTDISCFSCQKVFRIEGEGVFACPHCGTHNGFQTGGSQETPSEPMPKSLSAWEAGWRVSFLHSFIETSKLVLFHPVLFFRGLEISPRFMPVVTFSVIAQTVGYLFSMAYQIGFSLLQPALFGALFQKIRTEDILGGFFTPIVLGGFLLLMPLFALVGIIFSTALYHFVLWILRGANNRIEGTLNAVCYASAAQLFLIVPLFGGMAAGIWQMVVVIIGLREIHGIPTWKAVLSVLLPILVCCLAVLALVGLGLSLIIPLIFNKGIVPQATLSWLQLLG